VLKSVRIPLALILTAGLLTAAGRLVKAADGKWDVSPVQDFTPHSVPWVEPPLLTLPSAEELETFTVKGRTYDIKKISPGAGKDRAKPIADFNNANEALYFRGTGGGGLRSKERLIVEDCTFIIDFKEGEFETWSPRRAGIFVEGFREVLVRNCVFISKARKTDPLRKVIGSVIAYDCVNVQVEDSYFEGRTIGFRGHVLAFCCGPTQLKNLEVNGKGESTGGLWVASGFGEGKVGWEHQDNLELAIYPPGPLRVENCWIHDQKGKENSDGIYVQSVRPFLIRNCKVEKWSEDSLIDVGFRDVGRKWKTGFTVNHGGLGLVENCEFSDGWVKDSVGLGGALIFRNNTLRKAWFFPYAFDGGQWYVLSNKFELGGAICSGRNGQTTGWTPPEGMLTHGSKMHLYNNVFESKDARQRPLYIGGAKPAALKDVIVADYNVYAMAAPKTWALESKGIDTEYKTLDEWRAQTGNDKNSVLGAGTREQFSKVDPSTLKLPSGFKMEFGEAPAGLTGPVGVLSKAVLDKAKEMRAVTEKELSDPAVIAAIDAAEKARAAGVVEKRETVKVVQAERDGKKLKFEFENLPLAGKTYPSNAAKASGGAYSLWVAKQAGDSLGFTVDVPTAGTYTIFLKTTSQQDRVELQLEVNGKSVGAPVKTTSEMDFGKTALLAGPQKFSVRLVSPADSPKKLRFDRLDLLAE